MLQNDFDQLECVVVDFEAAVWKWRGGLTTFVSLVISNTFLFLHTLIVRKDTTQKANEDQTP